MAETKKMSDEAHKGKSSAAQAGETAAAAEAHTSEVRAVVDRIEDGAIAVLMLDDEAKTQIDVPLAQLPDGTTDGDHLRLTLRVNPNGDERTLVKAVLDKKSRAVATERVSQMQERLARLSGTDDQKDFKL